MGGHLGAFRGVRDPRARCDHPRALVFLASSYSAEHIALPHGAAFTGPLFMPIVGVLLDSVDCVDREDGSGSAGASSVWALESSPDIKCGSPFHLMLAVPCMLMLAVYTVIALRIQRVRGNLASIEFEWKRPWVLRNDMLVRQWVRHPLQPVDDESNDPTDAQLIDTVSATNAVLARLWPTTEDCHVIVVQLLRRWLP